MGRRVSAGPAPRVSFDDARRIAYADMLRYWRPEEDGLLMVAEYGWEDDTHWSVVVGAYEYLVEDDSDYCRFDAPALLVDKQTGDITRLVVIESFDRFDKMRPVGKHPDD